MEDTDRMILEESRRLLEDYEGQVAACLFSRTGVARATHRALLRDLGGAITGIESMLVAREELERLVG